ncbi:hypothetical protein PFICI_08322 [Pestalotiopsis fici W106-1]|uniref:Heterokaryon incompatibility domain-containing protein n=1 Tax=Pestalotiopsis fici (strain W106-1 / CGMCC3.15140) TaxID=1229662 RepID=W3X3T4_PESFW|nr:uncharacterized protein PFICI_08322 [Pestalotiopsis fici W106-1]ETS80793.1 hypothetical protein PFICI_08322 [Pestalotiopsis fici W106-1]
MHDHPKASWKSGQAAGCDFCNLVTLVIQHASTQHRLKSIDMPTFNEHGDKIDTNISVWWGRKFDRFVLTIGYFTPIKKGENTTYTITACPEKKTWLLEAQSAKLTDRSSPAAINLIQWWLEDCKKRHTSCTRATDGFMPSRLLKISDGMVKLELDIQTTEPYVALSHCWGPTKPIKLLENNLQAFQQGISETNLPRTFREAVKTSQRLGYEYIWIDSLCIIQDSDLDWKQQSSFMASVYGNAALVLAASSSRSSEDGFLRRTKDNSALDHLPGITETCIKLRRRGRSRRIERSVQLRLEILRSHRGPLDDRAWAYQEEAVAKRYLSFGNLEMMWCCTEAIHSEFGSHSSQHVEAYMRMKLTTLFTSITDPRSLGTYWRRTIVFMYSCRKLTYQCDILVALSAIAQAFHFKANLTYLAGLWKEDLLRGLSWYNKRRSASQQQYCPSWSWTSVGGTSQYYDYFGSLNDDSEPCAVVVQAGTSPATTNIFGPVSDGLVVLRGPSAMATLKLNTTGEILQATSETFNGVWSQFYKLSLQGGVYQDTPLVKTSVLLRDGTREISARRLAFGESIQAQDDLQTLENQTTNVWILPLHFVSDGSEIRLQILVLGRDEMDPDRFQRLGLISQRVRIEGKDKIDTFHKVMQREMVCREFTIV